MLIQSTWKHNPGESFSSYPARLKSFTSITHSRFHFVPLLWAIYNSKPRLSADTSTSESEEVENPRLEKKALSPVGGGQAKGPTRECLGESTS